MPKQTRSAKAKYAFSQLSHCEHIRKQHRMNHDQRNYQFEGLPPFARRRVVAFIARVLGGVGEVSCRDVNTTIATVEKTIPSTPHHPRHPDTIKISCGEGYRFEPSGQARGQLVLSELTDILEGERVESMFLACQGGPGPTSSSPRTVSFAFASCVTPNSSSKAVRSFQDLEMQLQGHPDSSEGLTVLLEQRCASPQSPFSTEMRFGRMRTFVLDGWELRLLQPAKVVQT